MSSHNPGHGVHVAHQAQQAVENLEPLAEEKNPIVAFFLGVFFGALGVSIYFKSVKDFFVCLFVFILLTVMIPGLGAVPGWLFAGFYGAYRAHSSNERRRGKR
jgi:Kef-type K+ transport system membrane component KefB